MRRKELYTKSMFTFTYNENNRHLDDNIVLVFVHHTIN